MGAIYYKSANLGIAIPSTWTAIPEIGPLNLNGVPDTYGYIAQLNLTGIRLPSHDPNWGIGVRLLHGETVIAESWIGTGNGPFTPTILLGAAGTLQGTDGDIITATWWNVGSTANISGPCSLGVVVDALGTNPPAPGEVDPPTPEE